jgi:pantetheine-phosphate adenylyltransferase
VTDVIDMSERQPVVAINPGTFDPVTFGHLDVIKRAAGVFDMVVVGVVRDPHHKQTMFTVEERVAFLEDALSALDNVVVDVFSELVVEFARKHRARTMIKGLRVIADFEWEFQMNRLNQMLAPEIETMYVMSSPEYSFISSSAVKEIAAFGGKVDELVPEPVARRFAELYPLGRPGTPENPQE